MQIDNQILTVQLERFLTMILLGFFARKCGLLNDALHDKLNTTIMRVIVPALLISNMGRASGADSLQLLLPMLLGGTVIFVFLLCLGWVSGWLLGFRGDTLKVQTGATFMGSVGFFGLPLVSSLLPGLGATAFGIYSIVDNVTVWTVGLAMSRGEQTGGSRSTLRQALGHLLQPATIAVFLGLLLLLFKVPQDNVLFASLSSIGDCSNPLAMLCIGASIARSDLRALVRSWPAFSIVLLRMIAAPLLIYRVCTLLGVYEPATICLTMVGAIPSSSMFALMCKDNGNTAAEYASGIAVITVLCSVVTIPLVFRLVG